jgi:hypothetical protein
VIAVLLWVWIAVGVVAVVVLAWTAGPLLFKLGTLRRTAVKLRRRQADVIQLSGDVAAVRRSAREVVGDLRETGRRIAALAPGSGRK